MSTFENRKEALRIKTQSRVDMLLLYWEAKSLELGGMQGATPKEIFHQDDTWCDVLSGRGKEAQRMLMMSTSERYRRPFTKDHLDLNRI